jgi:hypothetical protein
MTATAVSSVGLWALAVLVCAGLSRVPNRAAGLGAIAMATLALLAPLGLPDSSIIPRFMLTCLGVLVVGRTLDLTWRATQLSYAGRVWLLIALFDVRRATRVATRFDGAEVRWLLIHAVVVAAAVYAIVRVAPGLDGPLYWSVRWAFGAVFCFAFVEALHSVLLIGYRLGRIGLPRINDAPIRSTTLAEFWGRRWNRVVAGWLRDYLFFPLARRRKATLGICAAFGGSTILHFWIAWVPLDVEAGLLMASFFVVQGVALLLERRIGVERWTRAGQRSWTIAWMLVSSPLFVEPALRMYLDWAIR